jgi:hypothetical protein
MARIPPPAEAAAGPLRGALDDLKGAAARYAAARLELLKVEAAEAAVAVRRKVAALALAVLGLGSGYGLLLVSAVGWAERWWPGCWPLATLVLALVHLAAAAILLAAAARRPAGAFFAHSLEQLKQDEAWIKQQSAAAGARAPRN